MSQTKHDANEHRTYASLWKESVHLLRRTFYFVESFDELIGKGAFEKCAIHFAISFRWYAFPNFCTQISRPLAYGERISSKGSTTAVGSNGRNAVLVYASHEQTQHNNARWVSCSALWKYVFGAISVSVCHHGHVNSVKVEIKLISPREQALFSLCTIYAVENALNNLSVSIRAKYWVSWLSLDIEWTWRRAIKIALEFIVWFSNRWLKIEVTIRQKAYFRVVVQTLVFLLLHEALALLFILNTTNKQTMIK